MTYDTAQFFDFGYINPKSIHALNFFAIYYSTFFSYNTSTSFPQWAKPR